MKKMLLIAAMAAITMNVALLGQSITVTAPTAGNDWCLGSAHTITWTKSGAMQDTVVIRLKTPGAVATDPPVVEISAGTANDGSFPWTVPASVPEGDYILWVRTLDSTVIGNSGIFHISDCTTTPTITVTAPHAGSDWCRNRAYTITWTKSGDMQNTVVIRLKTPGAVATDPPVVEISAGTTNDGSFPWTIPASVPVGDYVLWVRTLDSTVIGNSGTFHINSCVIDPGLLEKLKRNRYWEVKWPPGPDPCLCPEWKLPDFRDFREFLGEKFGGSIVLLKNGAKLQELGTFGGRKGLPGSVKANLSRKNFDLLKNGGAKFSIAILDSNGSILNESALEQGGQVLR